MLSSVRFFALGGQPYKHFSVCLVLGDVLTSGFLTTVLKTLGHRIFWPIRKGLCKSLGNFTTDL
jgi:hypothetical protein